jgi:uncharacterized protein involved in outer membrane biogenesis
VPSSIFSDKVIVKAINVQAPEITFETDLKANNLSKILANLEEATGDGKKEPAAQPTEPKETKADKKLEVDDFLITGGKVHLLLNRFGGAISNR